MSNDIFKNIIKKMYNFEDEGEAEEKKCSLCGQPIGDFNDNDIYEGEYCEECFNEAEKDRLR